jgi:hypothetical protein
MTEKIAGPRFFTCDLFYHKSAQAAKYCERKEVM